MLIAIRCGQDHELEVEKPILSAFKPYEKVRSIQMEQQIQKTYIRDDAIF